MKTDDVVALKKVKMVKEAYKEGFPRTAIREMNILVQFHHPKHCQRYRGCRWEEIRRGDNAVSREKSAPGWTPSPLFLLSFPLD